MCNNKANSIDALCKLNMAAWSILFKTVGYAIFFIFWLFRYCTESRINYLVPSSLRLDLASATGTPLPIWVGNVKQLWPFLVNIWGIFMKFLKFGSTLTLLTSPLVIKKASVIFIGSSFLEILPVTDLKFITFQSNEAFLQFLVN